MTLTEAKARVERLERENAAVADLLADAEERHRTLRKAIANITTNLESNGPRAFGRRQAVRILDSQMHRTRDIEGLLAGARERLGGGA